MSYKIDLHTHTYASGHGYSTLSENMMSASKKGMELVAYTEHGPRMMGGPHQYFFNNLKVLPPFIHGVRVLKGIECNILNRFGLIDCEERALKHLDIIGAGLHNVVDGFSPKNKSENTLAVINAMRSKKIDFITHIGNPQYEIDYEALVKAAVEFNIAIEINNASFRASRPGSAKNCEEVIRLAKIYGATLCAGSDAHYEADIGNLEASFKIIQAHNFPSERVLNHSIDQLLKFLNTNGNTLRQHEVKAYE